jgi:Zn-dependent protease
MGSVVAQMVYYIVQINIVLMIFNLLPIPPLDGFGILTELFDLRQKDWYYQFYNNGFMILLALMIFNVTDKVLVPAVTIVNGIIMNIFF